MEYKNSLDAVVVKDQIEKTLKYVSMKRNIKKFKSLLNDEGKLDINKMCIKVKKFNFS